MADITLRILWYRLNETFSQAQGKYDQFIEWCTEFSWSRVDFLDMLFLGWLLAALVVVGAINLYLKFFGHAKSQLNARQGGEVSPRDGETTNWLNAYISWMHKHYESTPELLESWIRALNEHLQKNVTSPSLKVERLQPGCPPPSVSGVSVQSQSHNSMVLLAGVAARDSALQVSALQRSPTAMRVEDWGVKLQFTGQVRVVTERCGDLLQVSLSLSPESPRLQLTASTSQIDSQTSVKAVEDAISAAILNSVTSFSLSVRGGYPQFLAGVKPGSFMPVSATPNTAAVPQPDLATNIPFMDEDEAWLNDRLMATTESALRASPAPSSPFSHSTSPASVAPSLPPETRPETLGARTAAAGLAKYEALKRSQFSPASSPTASLHNRRLLVKIIKANGLGDKEFACTGPYCTVQLDEPPQRHVTSTVSNTVNPFWDESRVLELSERSSQVKFELFDKDKPPGIDFLGRAVIPMSELKRMPSSRQIIPLTGKPGATTTSGSVTVEFLFLESGESPTDDLSPSISQPAQLGTSRHSPALLGGTTRHSPALLEDSSPRRRIETSRGVNSSGVLVTSMTTRTERPRDFMAGAGYTDTPSRVEKSEGGDGSVYSGRSSLHAHEAGLTASHQGGLYPRGGVPPGIILPLGSDGYEPIIPIIQTPDERRPSSDLDPAISPGSAHKKGEAESEESRSRSSFADTLKKKFARKPKPNRSLSVDRASSMTERSLLRPPDTPGRYSESESEVPEAGLQKNRAHSRSFGSSLKRLFKPKRKEAGVEASRESSVSRQSTRSAHGALTVGGDGPSRDPVTSQRDDFSYSTSVPGGGSPLYDQYNSH